MTRNPLSDLAGLGEYLREQRVSARLSLRQLSELAGVSNPYLSQIERGLKRPSAEILQQLAKGLQVSSESLYVRAGLLDGLPEGGQHPSDSHHRAGPPDAHGPGNLAGRAGTVEESVLADRRLSHRQKTALLDIYRSFVGSGPRPDHPQAAAARRRTDPQK